MRRAGPSVIRGHFQDPGVFEVHASQLRVRILVLHGGSMPTERILVPRWGDYVRPDLPLMVGGHAEMHLGSRLEQHLALRVEAHDPEPSSNISDGLDVLVRD